MANHTPEPWRVEPGPTIIGSGEDSFGMPNTVARLNLTVGHYESEEVNARRIVACVNACAGIPTKWLIDHGPYALDKWQVCLHLDAVTAQRDELLKALKQTRKELNSCQSVIHYHGGFDPAYVQDALKAIKLSDSAIAKCEVKNDA